MKKAILVFLMLFLVFGIMVGSPLVFAEKGENPGKAKGITGSVSNNGADDLDADSGDGDEAEDGEDDTEGGARGKRHIKIRGTEVETELEIEEEFEGNETEFNVTLSNGKKSKVKVMPDQIPQIVRAKIKNMGENYTIEIKEKIHKNIPRVVYNVQTNQNGKYLGVLKLTIKK